MEKESWTAYRERLAYSQSWIHRPRAPRCSGQDATAVVPRASANAGDDGRRGGGGFATVSPEADSPSRRTTVLRVPAINTQPTHTTEAAAQRIWWRDGPAKQGIRTECAGGGSRGRDGGEGGATGVVMAPQGFLRTPKTCMSKVRRP